MTTNGSMVVHTGDKPALAKAAGADQTRAFEPRDMGEAIKMAGLLVASGLMPRGVQRPESAFAIIATGRELGLTAMQSLRSIHIIEGKPTLSADLIAALCKSRPDVCQFFRLVESTDKVATYETHRRGEPSPTRMSWTWEDATRAGVTSKDNWRKYPAAMLRARAITALARAVYPDLAMGIYDPDEVYDDTPPAPVRLLEIEEPVRAPAEPDSQLFRDLCDQIDAAENKGALNKVATAARRGRDAGTLTTEQVSQLAKATKTKGALLADMAPKPPKSEPRAADDADMNDANEAEAEMMHAGNDQ